MIGVGFRGGLGVVESAVCALKSGNYFTFFLLGTLYCLCILSLFQVSSPFQKKETEVNGLSLTT